MVHRMVFELEGIEVNGANGRQRLSIDGLRLPSNGMTVIVGPSGAGKSTLLRLFNRLENPDGGLIRFHGRPIGETDPLDLRRAVGMVFQEPVRFPGTVFDNLREADPSIDERTAESLLKRTGLDGTFLTRPADELSGGEAQRMCIARALATGPTVLLMDEPTSSLDPAATRQIEEQALALAETGVPVLWVTHDTGQMHRIASHVICLIDGSVAYEGPAIDMPAAPDPRIAEFLAERPS